MTKNVFKLHGAVLKLNVEDGSIIEKELPDGLFPSEPIFVPHPNATHEDDGVVLMSGIDGGRGKGFLMVYNATTMDVVFHATAPKLTLFGVHSKFFPFSVGCTETDCTPGGTTPQATTAEVTTDEGTTAEGTTSEGTTSEGTTAEGTTAEGTTADGTTAEGTTAEGTTAEGTTPKNTANADVRMSFLTSLAIVILCVI